MDRINKSNLIYDEQFVQRQKTELETLDFRKSKLYLQYNQKFKAVDRRAKSMVLEYEAVQGKREIAL